MREVDGAIRVQLDEDGRVIFDPQRDQPSLKQLDSRTDAVVIHEDIVAYACERERGATFQAIADAMNATQTPTAHGGALWHPGTVRSALRRS